MFTTRAGNSDRPIRDIMGDDSARNYGTLPIRTPSNTITPKPNQASSSIMMPFCLQWLLHDQFTRCNAVIVGRSSAQFVRHSQSGLVPCTLKTDSGVECIRTDLQPAVITSLNASITTGERAQRLNGPPLLS